MDIKQQIYQLLEQGNVHLVSAQMAMSIGDRAFHEPYLELSLELRVYPTYNPQTGRTEPVAPNFVSDGLRAITSGEE